MLLLASTLRGIAETEVGDHGAARSAFTEALTWWPKGMAQTPSVTARLALIYWGLGRTADAEQQQRKLEAIGYRHPSFIRDRKAIRNI